MNKKLMAVAVAGALAAPGLALAQQATSVQIYGLFDIRVDHMKYSTNTANTIAALSKQHVATGAPNRIGFRGTEALGGGLTAFWQIESQVFTDAKQDNGSAGLPNALIGGRPTFVGLRGGWGEVSLGLQDTVYGDVWKTTWQVGPTQGHNGIIMNNGNSSGAAPSPNCNNLMSPVTGTITGGNTAVAGQATLCQENEANATAFDRRLSNTILYRSPVISGFRFGALVNDNSFKEPTTSTPAGSAQFDPRLASFSLTWAGGPFSAAVAYEQHEGFGATNTPGSVRNAKDKGVEFGGRYNYGRGLIGAGYEQLEYENTLAAPGDNSFKLKNWVVQGTFNITPADVVAAGYSKTNGRTDCGSSLTSAGLTPTCGSATGSKMWTLSIDHNFSKRTAVYGLYSKIDNNASATYYYIAGPSTTTNGGTQGGLSPGQDVTTYQLGIKHTF
jgi:predicted porin